MLSAVRTSGARSFALAPHVMVDKSSNSIETDMSKCVSCQSCVRACTNIAGQKVLKIEKINGKGIAVTANGKPFTETNCIGCGQCTLGCPTGALTEKFTYKDIMNVLKNKNGRICVAQTAPAVRINMAEALGVPVGTISTGKVVTALKMLGFDYVFDTNFGADLTIVEESTELLERLNNKDAVLPMFTSCCPAWVNYVERNDPSLIPHLSSCRSPVGMISAAIKSDFAKAQGVTADKVYNVAVMPCTAKKDEAKRPQLRTKDGVQETDDVLTSRELAKMIKEAKIDFKNLKDTPYDGPYEIASGGGAIFCATGGVMEAALRDAHKAVTGESLAPIEFDAVRGQKDGVKFGTLELAGRPLKVAVAHGIKNAMGLIKKIKAGDPSVKDVAFVEVMACPGGCVCGGGAPKAKTKKAVDKRLDATYTIDRASTYRTCRDNPQVIALYQRSVGGKFGSHEAHELFHTKHTQQKK